MESEKEQWCIEQHTLTNHCYDDYLPYSFHLRMVATAAENFKHLLDDVNDYHRDKRTFDKGNETTETLRSVCMTAAYGHDLIEDTRSSYSDVKAKLGQAVADVVYAVSNEKGKSRKERANDKYYEGIRNTKGAVFVKLADRIANVQYSKLTKSRMFEMYTKENPEFIKSLGCLAGHPLEEMFLHLNDLFKNETPNFRV